MSKKYYFNCKSIEEVYVAMIKDKIHEDNFKHVAKLYQIALTLPVTESTCERSFSALKLIKNRLRYTMTENRINNLLLISIDRTMAKQIMTTEILEKFLEKDRKFLLK